MSDEQASVSRAERRKARLLVEALEVAAEEAEALKMTEEQRQMLLRTFVTVKAEFMDLDGLRWTQPTSRLLQVPPSHRGATATTHSPSQHKTETGAVGENMTTNISPSIHPHRTLRSSSLPESKLEIQVFLDPISASSPSFPFSSLPPALNPDTPTPSMSFPSPRLTPAPQASGEGWSRPHLCLPKRRRKNALTHGPHPQRDAPPPPASRFASLSTSPHSSASACWAGTMYRPGASFPLTPLPLTPLPLTPVPTASTIPPLSVPTISGPIPPSPSFSCDLRAIIKATLGQGAGGKLHHTAAALTSSRPAPLTSITAYPYAHAGERYSSEGEYDKTPTPSPRCRPWDRTVEVQTNLWHGMAYHI